MPEAASASKTYSGVIVPLITPLTNEGDLDELALRRLIDTQAASGVRGIFVLGTTGEGSLAPREMRNRVVHLAIEQAGGRVQVYAGIMDTVMDESVAAGRDYLRRGTAAVVAALPGYFRLTPEEQFRYFATLVERIRGPILLYDIPITVNMSIDLGVIEHLRAFPNLVGIKDSSGDRDRLAGLLDSYGDDPRFSVLVGTSALASFGLRQGADGFIPSAGNLNPALCARLCQAASKGDWALMDELQRTLDATQAEFARETVGRSIARLKKLMSKRGLCTPRVFRPLLEDEGAV